MPKRTAILIRCTQEEADMIRHAAKSERRTISAYLLNAVHNRMRSRAHLMEQPWPVKKRPEQ